VTSRNKGFTMLEVMVAATLGLILMGLVFSFLMPTMKASVRGATRVELQQMAVMSLHRMAGDIQNTAAAGLSLSSNPPAVGVVRIKGVTSDGRQQWEDKMIVYTLVGGRIIRKEWPPGPSAGSPALTGSTPARVPPVLLGQIASTVNDTERVMASNVKSFSATTAAPPGQVSDPVTLKIEMEKKEAHRQEPERFSLTRVVSMKQRI